MVPADVYVLVQGIRDTRGALDSRRACRPRRPRPRRPALWRPATALVLAGLAMIGPTTSAGAAVHPDAAAQPTERGQTINYLTKRDGELVASYGDLNANSGPIALRPFDPTTREFGEATWVGTEEVGIERDGLWPHLDPRLALDTAATFLDGSIVHAAGATHMYDAARRDGSLWLAGQDAVGNAVVWRDGQVSLLIPPLRGLARFHFITPDLTVQAHDFNEGKFPESWHWDGSAWVQGPDLLPGWGGPYETAGYDPETFRGRTVMLSRRVKPDTTVPGLDAPGELLILPGERTGRHFYNFLVRRERLYGLAHGAVVRTSNLRTWERVAEVPPSSRALEIVAGELWVGTVDSQIIRAGRRLGG